MSIRISLEEKEKLQQLAKADDLSLSQLVRKAIKEYLANK
jgi:predicted transcriptional regulator